MRFLGKETKQERSGEGIRRELQESFGGRMAGKSEGEGIWGGDG